MLAIRLARVGATHQPSYRVVVSESLRTPRSKNREVIGYYDPRQEPPRIQIDRARAEFWMKRGARPSLTVRQLLEQAAPETPAVTARPTAATEGKAGGHAARRATA